MGGEQGHAADEARVILRRAHAAIAGGVTTRRRIALLALVAVMVVWGSTFVVTKSASAVPAVYARVSEIRDRDDGSRAPSAARCARRAATLGVHWRLLFLAFMGIALFTAAFNFALVYGSAAQGALLSATTPAVVSICAVLFLKERLSRRRVSGIALSIAGAVLIVVTGEPRTGDAPAPLLGAALMLFTVVLWGAYTVVGKTDCAADPTAVTFALSAMGAPLLVASMWFALTR